MSEEVKMPLPGSLQEIVGSLLFASETPLTAAELREAVRAVEAEEGENYEVISWPSAFCWWTTNPLSSRG